MVTLHRLPSSLLLLALSSLVALGALAQVPQELTLEEQQALMAQQARREAASRMLASGSVPLEGAIDPAEYVVGPGDVFAISTGGGLAMQSTVTVAADGALVVPEMGSFRVAGLSLAEAKALVEPALRRAYRNVPAEVVLARPRQFYVHVSGNVTHPGRHVMVPIARVEDAVSAGMDGQSPLTVLRQQQQETWRHTDLPALRNVVVRRSDGTRLTVDLLRYYATGDTGHNPYLLDGDAVFVPSSPRDGAALVYVERESEVSAAQERRRAQAYDYRPDDTVTVLLLVTGGPELLARTDRVRLLRTDAGGQVTSEVVDVAAIRSGAAPDLPLQPLDRLQIPRDWARTNSVTVEGYVTFPGTYPIVEGRTTLREVMAAAGGVRPEGLLRAAYLVRPLSGTAVSQLETVRDSEQRDVLLEQVTFEEARLSDLAFGSRRYLAREVVGSQRVSLALTDDPEAIPEIPLRGGDRFVVPRDPHAVLVLGQVRHPGYVAYREGADVDYYITQAGGRGPAATEAYVREAGTGYFRAPGAGPIRSGDYLFVDRDLIADTEPLQTLALQEAQLDFQREQAARAGRFQVIQTGLAVVSTAVGIVTTYLLIRDRSN